MKNLSLSRVFSRVSTPLRLGTRDIALIVLPTLLWAGVTLSRPYLLKTPCLAPGTACREASLPAIDRLVVHLDNENANRWSTWTQNASGAIATGVPLAWQALQVCAGLATPAAAITAAGIDLVLLLETTLWNGAIMESFRVFVQRPRPFVYRDPIGTAGAPAHYTSFYSGHTSFAAAAMTALLFILIAHGASRRWISVTVILAILMTSTTGFFRVWAGKHFVTDVLTGAIAGFLVAFAVALVHRPRADRVA